MNTQKLSKLISLIVDYDGCIDISDDNIVLRGEPVTDLEYLEPDDDMRQLADYEDCPVAYYNEDGEMLPLSSVPESEFNKMCDSLFEIYEV